MKQIWIIFLYTLKDAARKKAFKISTVLLLVLVFGACLIINLTSESDAEGESMTAAEEESEVDEDRKKTEGIIYYVDAEKLVPGGLEAMQEAFSGYMVEPGEDHLIETYRKEIAEDAEMSLVVVSEIEEGPFVSVVNKDFMSGIGSSAVSDVLTRQYIINQLEVQGVKGDVEPLLGFSMPISEEIAGEMDLSGYILGIVILMLMFFAIYYYGYGVSMSIATEKTSRVMETLVVSAKPSRILIGKCLAMGALGLLQIVGVMIFAAICYKLLVPADYLLMGMPLSLSSFTLTRAIIIIAYFILGYFLYAVMNAVCGAAVSKIEDINSAMMPVILISMISFYIGYFTALSASGSESLLQKVAMYIPFCSPFIVPFKILNGDVPTADILISLGLLIVAIVIIAVISIKIYTRSVLHYGNRLKLKEMLKLRS